MKLLNNYNEKVLVDAIAQGDETAFRHVYDAYRKRIYSYAFHLTESEDLAIEVVQEVFLKVWVNRKKIPEILNFNAWLHTIARNIFFDALKKKANEKKVLKELYLINDELNTATETYLLNKENEVLLIQALEKLPAQQKKIFELRAQGVKLDDIAGKMQLSKNTVKVHLSRALISLRKYFDNKTDSTLMLFLLLMQVAILEKNLTGM